MPVVVDANVIIHSQRGNNFDEAYTVEEVFKELESQKAKRKADSLNLKQANPGKESVKEIKKISEAINSPTSNADEKLAALALEKDLELLTDDKALQNLAEIKGIKYSSVMDTEIERPLEWTLRCENCGQEIESSPCHLCGSEQIQRKSRPYN